MRLRARRTFRSARVIALAAAMVMALSVLFGTTAASASSTITSRYFGMHAPGLATAFPNAPVGAINLTTNRVYWPLLQKAPGPDPANFDFTALHQLVDQSHAHGAQPLLVLGQTPDWASKTPATPGPGTVPKMPDWQTYVSAVVTEFGTTIDYQIWPEPNAGSNWQGTWEELAQLVAVASKTIHQVAPQAIVVSPAMVIRKPVQVKKFSKFFAQKVNGRPVGSYVDAVALDAYPLMDGTPEDSAAQIRSAHTILVRNKVTAPVWNVEINYGVAGSALPVTPLPVRTQASYVMRNFLLDAANGVRRVYWLGWAPFSTLGIQMVQNDGVTPAPAAAAYSLIQKWMLGRQVRSCTHDRKTRVWTCTLMQQRRASWVYWVPSGKAHVRAPKGARRVQAMSGVVQGTQAGKWLTVTNAPIWVRH